MSYDLTHFTLGDMLRCGLAIRRVSKSAKTMEEAAAAIVRHLYEACHGARQDERACVMVRFYKTHPFELLEPELQRYVREATRNDAPPSAMRCLVLLGTAGDEAAWNDRRASRDHRAVALPSEEIVRRAPMIAQLITQLGLPIAEVIAPTRELLGDLEGRTYNVFHVADAVGSPYIPAQADFVRRYGIRSVLGFGGMLQSGDLYAIIMFSRVPIERDVADRFRTIGLDVKSTVFRFKPHEIFSA